LLALPFGELALVLELYAADLEDQQRQMEQAGARRGTGTRSAPPDWRGGRPARAPERTRRARNAVDILIRARDEASRQLEQVETRLGRMARSTRRAVQREWAGLSRASTAATTGILAVGGAAITAATQMVRMAGQLEQSQIAF